MRLSMNTVTTRQTMVIAATGSQLALTLMWVCGLYNKTQPIIGRFGPGMELMDQPMPMAASEHTGLSKQFLCFLEHSTSMRQPVGVQV